MANRAINFGNVIDALRPHVASGAVTIKQLALWSGVSDRAVYLWFADAEGADDEARGPRAKHVNLWLQKLPDEAALDVSSAVQAGSRLATIVLGELDLDVNADGKIDACDAVDAEIGELETVQLELTLLRTACRTGGWTDEQHSQALSLLNRQQITSERVKRIIRSSRCVRTGSMRLSRSA